MITRGNLDRPFLPCFYRLSVPPQGAPWQRPVPQFSDGQRPICFHRNSGQPRQDQESQHGPGPHRRHFEMSVFISGHVCLIDICYFIQ